MISVFDAHFHIFAKPFPLVPNQSYIPDPFNCSSYLQKMQPVDLLGGVLVSASFQGYDQNYLKAAIKSLGKNYVAVTQLDPKVSDAEIVELDRQGVRGIRFNLYRGDNDLLGHLEAMAKRVYALCNWHVELYLDSKIFPQIKSMIAKLPAVSIDHLGLSLGLAQLMALVERGVMVKASGFGRVNMEISEVLKKLYAVNPGALMFGSDLPSTRAPRPFQFADIQLIMNTLGEAAGQQVLYKNAMAWYKMNKL